MTGNRARVVEAARVDPADSVLLPLSATGPAAGVSGTREYGVRQIVWLTAGAAAAVIVRRDDKVKG